MTGKKLHDSHTQREREREREREIGFHVETVRHSQDSLKYQ